MDKNYWINYYKSGNGAKFPTPFAEYVGKQLEPNKSILDIGCGNGRDSIYFFMKGLRVHAIDQADEAIEKNISEHGNGINFIADDFVNSCYIVDNQFDYLYSRFTIHAITKDEELELLKMAYRSLVEGGKIFIEARSINDTLYGKGEPLEDNAYIYNDHYRRFIVLDELVQCMESIGFSIIEQVEGNNMAIFKDENPVVVRVIAKK